MKAVTAIDSFKGSLTSIEAGLAVAEGFRRACPDIDVEVRPLADGGEGTVEALVAGMNGVTEHVTVTGPFGAPVDCAYGIIKESMTAVIEMSGAAGITLVPRSELDPMRATTYGVGEVIRDAIGKGCRRFIVGIGGSATNDGGAGMLQALGFGLLDNEGKQIAFGARGLKDLVKITDEDVLSELRECSFRVACDVTNPLCGEKGCSAVFGPQKGATPQMVRDMDGWLAQYADIAQKMIAGEKRQEVQRQEAQRQEAQKADPEFPGTGAAGGMGFAFLTFMNAQLEPGIQIVLEETRLEAYIKEADLVVTGEGMMDFQTSMGKAPCGVAALAKKYGKAVVAFAGGVTADAGACNEKGIDAFFPVVRGVTTLDEAMKPENAKRNVALAAEQAMRLFLIGK